MKNIQLYIAKKYKDSEKYKPIEEGIYFTHIVSEHAFTGDYYVMSLSLEQEPELGESPNDQLISQYPLEDIEDKYMVFMTDSYEELNATDNKRCYIELASEDLKDVQNLKEIIGKHVYNQETGDGYAKLIVE